MNYRPDGQIAVPIAGPFLVALQFLPMAARKAEGGMLLVHSEEQTLLVRFAKTFIEDNLRILAFAMPSTSNLLVDEGLPRELLNYDKVKKRYKTPDVKGPRSLVVADLTKIGTEAHDFEGYTSPLTVYLLSNSGQGPSLESFDIPGGVVAFVLKASGATTRAEWLAVARRFRDLKEGGDQADVGMGVGSVRAGKRAKKQSSPMPRGRAGWSKNPAFEDLCAIYEGGYLDRHAARLWLSRYVLGRMKPDIVNSQLEDTNARTWALAELFLKEVLGMKQGRIEAVRAFADKLAGWIRNKHDKGLYRSLMMDKPSDLRHSLMRVQRASAQGAQLLFGLDEYATVWLHEDGDEWLIRDLVCIRVVELLAGTGFFSANPELTPEELGNVEVTQ
jgi:CRISPR-associated protein Cst1